MSRYQDRKYRAIQNKESTFSSPERTAYKTWQFALLQKIRMSFAADALSKNGTDE